MVNPCVQKMREQVQIELTASMTYFAMVSVVRINATHTYNNNIGT